MEKTVEIAVRVIEYRESSIEEGWKEAVRAIGMEPGNPGFYESSSDVSDPAIYRKAENECGSTRYERWIENCREKNEGRDDYFGVIAKCINDPENTYEVVVITPQDETTMDICLFFERGTLVDIEYFTGGRGITLSDVLKKRGHDVELFDSANCPDFYAAIGPLNNIIIDDRGYSELFKLFMEELNHSSAHKPNLSKKPL